MRSRRLSVFGVCLVALVAAVLVAQVSSPALADTIVSTRIDDGDPVAAAAHIAGLRFASPTASSPSHVVLSRDDVFADSLAGAPLLANAPLLFTDTNRLSPATRTELERLRAGATKRLYILGGPVAVSPEVESAARSLGYEVVRLAGQTRIETSVAIADQVISDSPASQVLLARSHGNANAGSGWVDSVAGGAYAADRRIPVLLTHTDALHPAVADFLRRRGITTSHLLGGTVALSDAVFAQVPGPVRHWGDERSGTAAAIARELWGSPDSGPRAFTVVNGVEDRGWSFGLAAAGLAADRDAPVLLSLATVTPATRRLVATCGSPDVDLTIIGDGTLVSGAVREYLDDLDGEGCGPDRSLRRSSRLQQFDACPDLLDWYRTNAGERVTEYGLDGWYGATDFGGPQPMPAEGAPVQGESDAAGSPPASGAASATNVQEQGVDEPDIVKTDGQIAAVVLTDGSVDLIDLTGASPRVASHLPATNLYGQTEALLHGDVLTLLTTNASYAYFAESDAAIAPGQPQPRTTTVMRWNVADPDNPAELSAFEMDGHYRSARMIDGVARLVLQSTPQGLDFTYPEDDSEEARKEALAHNRQVVRDSTLDNWLPSWGAAGDGGDGEPLVACTSVNEPPAWSGFDAITVVTLDTATDTEPGATAAVVAQGENVYASHDRLLVTTGRWGEAFEAEQLDSTISTELHAFDITDPTAISYTGSGSVNGYVINQFALSEFGGDVRVAATKQPPWQNDQQQTESFVAVLREEAAGMTEVGRVGGLGLGERIQAVRFFGDLGVVVTFRQIDPLYLLDLSDGTRPVVTGELKDTGFSQYLHRVDEDLLMGVGVNADEDGNQLGAMVALYDISNRAAPTRVARYTVDDAQTPVGQDHHTFLYWPTTKDAVVPVFVYDENYRQFAAVLRVGDNTLTKRGELSHDAYASEGQRDILRTFVVGINLYSVSQAGLARHEIESLTTTSFTNFTN